MVWLEKLKTSSIQKQTGNQIQAWIKWEITYSETLQIGICLEHYTPIPLHICIYPKNSITITWCNIHKCHFYQFPLIITTKITHTQKYSN